MTDSNLLSDLIAWSAQVACVAAIGGVLPALLRLDAPGVRYAYFRALLVLCLTLPWLQGRHAIPEGFAAATVTSAVASIAPSPTSLAVGPRYPWVTLLVVCIVFGVAARGLWIVLGLARLAGLRRAGHGLPWVHDYDELQRMLGTKAEIRYVAELRQPVTFGVRRPLVLLPDSLRAHPLHVQRAVLSHELIHVQRRDWVWLVAEEIVRALFWFHPGMWWLTSRVQLAREEVVDQWAMLATGSRRGYIEALAAYAEERPLAPAAAFARRRHLVRRMRLISKGVRMSSKQIVLSSAVMALVVLGSTWYAVNAFPLREAAQQTSTEVGPLEKQAKPITPENPVPRRTYSVEPIYPAEAAAVEANAMVTLMITLDQFGRVAEIRRLGVAPISRPAAGAAAPDAQAQSNAFDALVASAADAIRQWQYDAPADAPLSIRVTYAFASEGKPRLVAHDGWSLASPGQIVGFGIIGGRAGAPRFAAPPPPPPPPPPDQDTATPPWATGALRIGGAVLTPTKTKHVNPAYPAVAQSARVQGVVIIEALIGVNGKVTNARVLRSVPLLDQAALDAVMLWEFTPTRLNGELVPVLMTMTVQFTLT